ncbi:MAG: FHA domain-containing protein, partial [Planctomycetota bacterium]
MLAKVTVRAPGATCHYLLAPERLLVVGRGNRCDIAIAETSVSRSHCTIALLGGELHVADLGASHGVSHRGQRVPQCRLIVGERVKLGAAELSFDEAVTPAAQARHAAELAASGCVELHSEDPAAPGGAAAPAAADSDDGEAWIGRTLGSYRITGVLGSGGSA